MMAKNLMFSYTKNKLYYQKVRKKLYIRQLSEFYVFTVLFRVFNAKKCENDQISANKYPFCQL